MVKQTKKHILGKHINDTCHEISTLKAC